MFDAKLRPLIDPPLNRAGRALAAAGIRADFLTALGLVLAVAAGALIAAQAFGWALALIIANRLLDGLDGAVARASAPSDFGGYFDILADFVFYVAIPLGFGFADPAHAMPALVLVASFALTGVSFLAFAAIAARRGEESRAHGAKSLYYTTGLAEGGETIAVFIAMTLWPAAFMPIAYGYAALCILTIIQRSILARLQFSA